MGRRLLAIVLLLLAGFVAEILVFIWLAGLIGGLTVFGIVVVAFALGCVVMRIAGASAVSALGTASRTGALPGGAVGDAALLFLGGGLLALPGIISSLIGLVLIFPPTRHVVRRAVGRSIGRRIAASGYSVVNVTGADGNRVQRVMEGDVIEGEVVDRHDEPPPEPPEIAHT